MLRNLVTSPLFVVGSVIALFAVAAVATVVSAVTVHASNF